MTRRGTEIAFRRRPLRHPGPNASQWQRHRSEARHAGMNSTVGARSCFQGPRFVRRPGARAMPYETAPGISFVPSIARERFEWESGSCERSRSLSLACPGLVDYTYEPLDEPIEPVVTNDDFAQALSENAALDGFQTGDLRESCGKGLRIPLGNNPSRSKLCAENVAKGLVARHDGKGRAHCLEHGLVNASGFARIDEGIRRSIHVIHGQMRLPRLENHV